MWQHEQGTEERGDGLTQGASIYGGSKAGIEGVLRHVCLEVVRNGVTVNALALGFMEFKGPEELVARMADTIPMGRLGRPLEIGAAAVFLASDDASYITGQTIHVNGGTHQGR